ncbi:O-antigen ligase family protein [Terricaulis silvestris]|uniref:Putative O-glycosylation ligase, exosortase A-associated n=1 Tax=Terricaulis silvestris TaxID=2686094 RepID=A0A6I6MGH6_9CAUL|nr:O-antigen ligase family protein [Terricaulis silvestris]QGZ93379.1 putative O-glycosylation ligase, exosortase A-associated [Terricaulis silvestris]
MDALIRRLQEINVGALGVLVILFTALLAEGANSAVRASLMAAVLLVALMIGVAGAPRRDLASVLSANRLSILALLVFLAWAMAMTAPGLPLGLQSSPHWAPVANAPLSLSPFRTLEGAVALLGPAAAFLLGALVAPDPNARDWVGRWVVALTILYALIALYGFFSNDGHSGGRLDVGISSANAAATLFGVLTLVGAGLIVRGARGRLGQADQRHGLPASWSWAEFLVRTPLSLAAVLLATTCLLLTASRGGLIATGVAFILFVIAFASQRLKQTYARSSALVAPLLALVILFVVLFVRGGERTVERFALASEDFEGREMLAKAHWQAFLERPLIGHGLNTYHEINALAATPENWSSLRIAGSAHNIYVQVLEETGLIGFALFALMLATPLSRAFTRIAGGGSGLEWAAIALATSALVLLHGLVDFGLQVPALAALFAFLVGAAVGRAQRRVGHSV